MHDARILTRRLGPACLVVGALHAGALGALAQIVKPPTRVSQPTVTAVPAVSVDLTAAYRDALSQPAVRDASRAELLRQLRSHRPIGFVNGYWVTPVDMARVYDNATVRGALLVRLGGTSATTRLAGVLRDRSANLGLVFTPNQFADAMLGDMHHDVTASIAGDALKVRATGLGGLGGAVGGALGGAVSTTDDIAWGVTKAMVDMASDALGTLGALWDWATSSGSNVSDPNTGLSQDDPNADPDGDGTPNRLDADDDGDGTNDSKDDYPYDPTEDICACGGRGEGTTAITFTNRYSADIMRVALGAVAALRNDGQAAVPLGTVAGQAALRLVIPATAR